MNKSKPNNDNLVKYHIRLNAEEYEQLKERLKEHLHDNKLHSYRHPSETLKCQWEQVVKNQLSPSATEEIKDRIAKWILTNEALYTTKIKIPALHHAMRAIALGSCSSTIIFSGGHKNSTNNLI